VTLVAVGQVAAYAAAQGAAQACADRRAGPATQAVTDDRTAGSAHATTDGRAGAAAFLGGNRTARSARDTSTDRGTGASTHALAHNVAQSTTEAATNGGSTVTGDCALSNQKTQNQSRQSETHDKNLKKGMKFKRVEIECFRGNKVQTCARSTSL
jgi:hypothetical protein